MKDTQKREIRSFNEPDVVVVFDPVWHTFHYNGKKLTSATNYIKKFYPEFDLDGVAKMSAKAWGVDEQELKDMWKSNGEITASLGTSVHSALEHYHKFQKIGKDVQNKKKMEENYALPKHPLIRNIVKEFIEADTFVGNVESEILITDVARGYCGLADRALITGERSCRIQDYKINIDSEKEETNLKAFAPFDVLPANKLTKYQLQMSFYANMLQKSGWKVYGLDAFVYEDKWKHYQMKVLDVIK